MMPKLTDAKCKTTRSDSKADVLLGDGNGLYLRIRPGGTRVWIIDYQVAGTRRKINVGNYDPKGSKAESVEGLLSSGSLSLAQARFVAASWKALRQAEADRADRVATEVLRNAQRHAQLTTLKRASDVTNGQWAKKVHTDLLS